MKILVIQQKMIGDVLASTVICDNLKKHLNNTTVHYLVNDHTTDVVEHHKSVDKLVIFKSEYKSDLRKFFGFLRQIRHEAYDVVIDVYAKTESNLITLASGAPNKISYKKWYSGWIYNHLFSYETKARTSQGLAIENRLMLLQPLMENREPLNGKPEIIITDQERENAELYLEQNSISTLKPLIMVSIQGSGPEKSYPVEYMSQLLNSIIMEADATYLFNYTPNQAPAAMDIYKNLAPPCRERVRIDIKPGNLRFFLTILSRCNGIIGNEGGPMNMAKALDIPTFSIFSPWIAKEAWDTYNHSPQNKAVHLKDYIEQPFHNAGQKELKKEAAKLYAQFKPEYFEAELKEFLHREVFPHQ